MAKFKEKICINCKHWTKTEKCIEYNLWVGTCPKVDIHPYENSDCGEWEAK